MRFNNRRFKKYISTFDGNMDIVYEAITNLKLNEFVRTAVFNMLEILQKYDLLKKEQIVEMLEKIDLVKKLYKQFRVNEQAIGKFDDFLDNIYNEKIIKEDNSMIKDTEKILSRWTCFKSGEENEKDYDKILIII